MSRPRLLAALSGMLAVAVLGGFLVFQQFLAGDSVPALSFAPSAAPGAVSPAGSLDPGPTDVAIEPTVDGIAGTWRIGSGSLVGYRVREQLGGVSALSDAVGRTSAVSGTATLTAGGTGITVTSATFEADLSQLKSDDGRRDDRIRSIGVETDRFPTATFTLTSPIDVPADALTGATTDVTVAGDLTIHGVTRAVTISGQARLNGNRIEVVADLTFPFSDFGMTPPSVAGFVAVQDDATLEVLLSLTKAAA